MSLDDIPAGEAVFIDSTVLHYAVVSFEPFTMQCIQFLERIANGPAALIGSLTLPVLNDAVHKVMCSEAVERFKRPRSGLVNWLKRNPAHVKGCRAQKNASVNSSMPIQIFAIDLQAMVEAQGFVNTFGVMASDALILADATPRDFALGNE